MRFEGTEEEFTSMLEERGKDFSDEFVQTISGLMNQISADGDEEEGVDDDSFDRIKKIYQYAIKNSMQKKFSGE
jgi:hypothetical protein